MQQYNRESTSYRLPFLHLQASSPLGDFNHPTNNSLWPFGPDFSSNKKGAGGTNCPFPHFNLRKMKTQNWMRFSSLQALATFLPECLYKHFKLYSVFYWPLKASIFVAVLFHLKSSETRLYISNCFHSLTGSCILQWWHLNSMKYGLLQNDLPGSTLKPPDGFVTSVKRTPLLRMPDTLYWYTLQCPLFHILYSICEQILDYFTFLELLH